MTTTFNAQSEKPTGLQLAVKLLAQIGDDESDRAIAAVHAAMDPEAQEPVAISKGGNLFWSGNPQDWRGVDCQLYARPVPAIPAGWKLVPVEPTAAMLDAGQVAAKLALGHGVSFALPAIYFAMINAAPEHKHEHD